MPHIELRDVSVTFDVYQHKGVGSPAPEPETAGQAA